MLVRFFLVFFFLINQLESSGKREPQLGKYLFKTGLQISVGKFM